jgi:hypothetical protein
LLAIALVCVSLLAADKRSKRSTSEAAAVIAVSVFKEPGFAVQGATVELAPAASENTGSKARALRGSTDPRGEFAFRVPPVPAQYTVMVAAKGLKSQQKAVSVQGEERVDATFMLQPESK